MINYTPPADIQQVDGEGSSRARDIMIGEGNTLISNIPFNVKVQVPLFN